MSKIRIALLAIALAALVVVAGCGSDEDSTSASGDSTSAATVSLSDCTPDTAGDEDRRDADGRHRQARLPALLRGRRPDQRQGLRERGRLRDRRPARLRRRRGEVDGGPVQRLLRAGPEGLRLRRQPDLDHAEARRAGRLLRARTTRPSRRSSRSRTPTSPSATSLADLAGRQHRRPDRHHQPRRGQRRDPADATSRRCSTTPTTSSRALKNGQVDAVVVDVPTAFYLTAAQVPEATTVGQFAAPGGDTVGRAAGEGLAADRLRLGGDRRRSDPRASCRRSRSSG